MSTPKTRKSKTSKNHETQTSDTATAAETPMDTGTQAETKPSKSAKADPARRVLSVNFPARTVRQLKLLASVQGVSLASIVIASVAKTVAKNLPAALEAISKADAESE